MNVVSCREYQLEPETSTNKMAIIENLADFAEDNGWTVDELRTRYNWNQASSGSGWVATPGGQGFLQLHCDNAQFPMTYRFYSFSFARSSTYTYSFCDIRMFTDEYRTYSTTGSKEHPIWQGSESHNMIGFSFTSLGFNPMKQWVMGNSKWILTVIQRTATLCASAFFGVPDVLNQNSEYGHILWKTCAGITHVHGGTGWPSTDSILGGVGIDNLAGPWSKQLSGGGSSNFSGGTTGNYGFLGVNLQNVTIMGNQNSSSSGVGFLMNLLLKTQTWSNKRVIVTPLIYSHPGVQKQFSPFAYMPIGIIRFVGLDIGQVLTYGSEEYKVFPFNSAYSPEGTSSVDRHCGWAVRIK